MPIPKRNTPGEPRAFQKFKKPRLQSRLLFGSELLGGSLDLRVILRILDLLLDAVLDLLLELGSEGGETVFQGITEDGRLLGSRSGTLALGIQGALLLGRAFFS